MIHFALPPASIAPPVPARLSGPMTPAAYLRLRRRAAGLTRSDVATRLATSARDVPIATSLVRSLETDDIRARQHGTILRLRSIFPFDPDVYWQLADQPPHRHPAICAGCGCSAHDRCADDDAECVPADGECSRCHTTGHTL